MPFVSGSLSEIKAITQNPIREFPAEMLGWRRAGGANRRGSSKAFSSKSRTCCRRLGVMLPLFY
jgi:hypothetical protein